MGSASVSEARSAVAMPAMYFAVAALMYERYLLARDLQVAARTWHELDSVNSKVSKSMQGASREIRYSPDSFLIADPASSRLLLTRFHASLFIAWA